MIQNGDLPTDHARIDALAWPCRWGRRPCAAGSGPASLQAAGNRVLVLMDSLGDAALARAEVLRARFPFLSVEIAPRRVCRPGPGQGTPWATWAR